MPNELSPAARLDVNSQEGNEVWVVTAVIDHASFVDPIRLVLNRDSVTIGGEFYVAAEFVRQGPTQQADTPPRAQIHISLDEEPDVSDPLRDIYEALAAVDVVFPGTRPTVAITERILSEPTTEIDPITLEVVNFDLSPGKVLQIDLGVPQAFRHQFPSKRITPDAFPGLF